MEQQNHNQTNKRINILIAVAGVAIIVGLAGLVIALMKPTAQTTRPSYPTGGSLDSGSSYQEVITPDSGGAPNKGTSHN